MTVSKFFVFSLLLEIYLLLFYVLMLPRLKLLLLLRG